MRSRRLLAAACGVLVIASSCSGHHAKVLGTTKSKAHAKAVPHSRTAPTAPPGVPKVILQSGTAYQNGALVQFCAGSSCRQGTGKPARAQATPDPLLFIIDRVPLTAQVQVTHAGAATPSDTRALHVGSMMLYAPTVRAGSYVVRLSATWKDGNGSWVFAISIPKT